MDIKDRKRIQRNYEFLIEDMSEVVDDVIDYCYSKEILSTTLKASLSTSIKRDKCRKFIDMFLKKKVLLKEEIAFVVLCDALDNCNSPHIKDVLKSTEVDDVTEEEEEKEEKTEDGDQNGASGDAGRQTTVFNIQNSSGFHIGNNITTNVHYSSPRRKP